MGWRNERQERNCLKCWRPDERSGAVQQAWKPWPFRVEQEGSFSKH